MLSNVITSARPAWIIARLLRRPDLIPGQDLGAKGRTLQHDLVHELGRPTTFDECKGAMEALDPCVITTERADEVVFLFSDDSLCKVRYTA